MSSQGWICPKCHQAISPFTTVCPCSAQPQATLRFNPPPVITVGGTEERCMIADYFAAHPNETSVNLYCGCRLCSAQCSA